MISFPLLISSTTNEAECVLAATYSGYHAYETFVGIGPPKTKPPVSWSATDTTAVFPCLIAKSDATCHVLSYWIASPDDATGSFSWLPWSILSNQMI